MEVQRFNICIARAHGWNGFLPTLYPCVLLENIKYIEPLYSSRAVWVPEESSKSQLWNVDSVDIEKLIGLVKEYGVERTFDVASEICWFAFPFLLWWEIYILFGRTAFVDSLAFLGQVCLMIFMIFSVLTAFSTTKYEQKLMKRIEYAKQTFENPSDMSSESKFRTECRRFLIPYLYAPPMFMLGWSESMKMKIGWKLILVLASGYFFGVYISYSTVDLILLNQNVVERVYTWGMSFYPNLSGFIGTAKANLILLLIATFIIGFTSSMTYSSLKKPWLRANKKFLSTTLLTESLHVHVKVAVLISELLTLPIYLAKRRNMLAYEPFNFPTNLHLVLQQAAHNVGRKSIRFSEIFFSAIDEREISTLKDLIKNDKNFPTLVRLVAMQATIGNAVDIVKSSQPEICLGVTENDCAFIGSIYYDTNEKVRKAQFFFDKYPLKQEFKLIADKEIERQRELKELLPKLARDILSSNDGEGASING